MNKLILVILVFSFSANARLWGSNPPPQFGPLPSAGYDRVVKLASSSGDNGVDNFLYFRFGRVYFISEKGDYYGSKGGYPLEDVQRAAASILAREDGKILGKRLSWTGQGILYGFLGGAAFGFSIEALGGFMQPFTMTPYGNLIDIGNPTELMGLMGYICAGTGGLIAFFEAGKAHACARKVNAALTAEADTKKEVRVSLTDASAQDTFKEIIKMLDNECQLEMDFGPPPRLAHR